MVFARTRSYSSLISDACGSCPRRGNAKWFNFGPKTRAAPRHRTGKTTRDIMERARYSSIDTKWLFSTMTGTVERQMSERERGGEAKPQNGRVRAITDAITIFVRANVNAPPLVYYARYDTSALKRRIGSCCTFVNLLNNRDVVTDSFVVASSPRIDPFGPTTMISLATARSCNLDLHLDSQVYARLGKSHA